MKKIYMMLLAFATALSFSSCTDDEGYFSAGEDDFPRILNTDIPETSGGELSPLPSIYRNNNFHFEVVVTPSLYTTVTWFIDGEQVYEGNTIDMPLLAGDYNVKIVATTTKGKQTWRNCSLSVLPLEDDPALADDAKSRWMNPGATVTINGENLEGITALTIGGVPVTGFQNNGNSLTFVVPELAEGDYAIVVEKADGKYGCGKTKVTTEKYKEPGIVEVPLWEGSNVINWGDSNVTISAEQLANVPVGTTIKLYYNVPDAEYHALRITTPWWGDNPEDDLVRQFDVTADTPNPFEFTYDEACKKLVDERGGMLIVGFGYELTKVTYEMETSGNVVWEGSQDINWGETNLSLSLEECGVKAGKTLVVDYVLCDMPDGYHCAKVVTGPAWVHQDILDQFDLTADGSFELAVTDEMIAKAGEDGGAFLIVGYGFTVKKVSVK